MFSIDDLLELFEQLGRIASDPKDRSHSAAILLCKQYLVYLAEKEEKPEIKANYFKDMLRNFIGQPKFNSQIIELIYLDLKNNGGDQHLTLLQNDEINLVEMLQNQWKKHCDQVSSENQFNNVPQKMQVGFNNAAERKSADEPEHQPSPAVTSDIMIQYLFENNVTKIKSVLSRLLLAKAEDCVESLYSRNGFDLLYRFIKTPDENDQILKQLAIQVLARFGQYFLGNRVYINDNELVLSLFDELAVQDAETDKNILKVLSLCSADCFTQDNIRDLRDILIRNDISLTHRYYALLCIINIFKADTNDMAHCINPILNLFTLRYPEDATRQIDHIQQTIARFLIESLETLKRYFQQKPYPTKLIELACTQDVYPSSDESIRLNFLHVLSEVLSKKTESEVVFQEDAIRSLIDFFLYDAKNRHFSTLIKIIVRMSNDTKIPHILFDTGTIVHLLKLLKSQQLESSVFVGITYILMSISFSHLETRALCIENKLYFQMLTFWKNNKNDIQDIEQETYLFKVMALFFSIAPCSCKDDVTVIFVLDHLLFMPQSARHHLLNFLDFALQENSSVIQLGRKKIFQSIGCWLKTEPQDNQILILNLISIHLKEHANDVHSFWESNGYHNMKTLLHDHNPLIVRATIIAISELIIYPEIEDDLLSHPSLVYKIHALSNGSRDEKTRYYADLIFTKRDLQEANRLLQDGKFYRALILYKKIVTRSNPAEINAVASLGAEKALQLWKLTPSQFRRAGTLFPASQNDDVLSNDIAHLPDLQGGT